MRVRCNETRHRLSIYTVSGADWASLGFLRSTVAVGAFMEPIDDGITFSFMKEMSISENNYEP